MQIDTQHVYSGVNAQVGEFLVNRLLPDRRVLSVGPIVFLDHIYPRKLSPTGEKRPNGDFVHPHRGIATFSYVFNGRLTHYDSQGNKSTIGAGGVQWMKAASGIIHDEQPFVDDASGPVFHSLQCWINLPGAVKAELPAYRALQDHEVPEIGLPDGSGKLRILLGTCGSVSSPIPTFLQEFIYHLQLGPKSRFTLARSPGIEYGSFVPGREVVVNGEPVANSKIIIFEKSTNAVEFANSNVDAADVLIFGGKPYVEPIVAEGPFVMNSRAEIAEAYRDFFDGKYGGINYSHARDNNYV